jgi:hypothetical protein
MPKSQYEDLTLEAIEYGKAVQRINELLTQIGRDVIARPLFTKPRTLTLTVKIAPQYDPEARENFPKISWDAGVKIPGVRGQTTSLIVRGGKLQVNTQDPYADDPRQQNFLEGLPEIVPVGSSSGTD